MIAKAFQNFNLDNVVFFTSGVSNSKDANLLDYAREEKLLKSTIALYPDNIFIYFSSCSLSNNILCTDSYHTHKLHMEDIIQTTSKNYFIFRLPNVIAPDNMQSKTLIPYLVSSIIKEKSIKVWSGSVRNIIDINDIVNIVNYILSHNININNIINIANPSNISILSLINIISMHFNMKVDYSIKKTKQEVLNINIDEIKDIIDILKIQFDDSYLNRILKKYYKIEDT